MDKETRNAIERATQRARKILEDTGNLPVAMLPPGDGDVDGSR